MTMTNQPEKRGRHYSVSVGFARVRVMARTTMEAIEAARTRLASEMPRLWDVIQGLEPRRFQVTLDNEQ